jgi:hypothetical protein
MWLWIPLYDVPERAARLGPAELRHIHSEDRGDVEPRGEVSWRRILARRRA